MMLDLVFSHQFRKDLKSVAKRGLDLRLLQNVIDLLRSGQELPMRNKDHQLSSNFAHFRECHIQPDWLMIYQITEDSELYLFRTGSHSDLF